jgi:hypothetical protein
LNLGASSLPPLSDIISGTAGAAVKQEPSCHDARITEVTDIQKIRGSIVCKMSDQEFSKLRITRAYIKLLCIPEGGAKMVSLARIGSYEVRMFESSQSRSDTASLFSIELFDHDAQSSVDSCVCYDIEEAVAAFQDFISR